MHRTDGDSNVAGLFDAGDPGVPREPTQVDPDWLNAIQEELANTIEAAGVALVKGTNTQLLSAIRIGLGTLSAFVTRGIVATQSVANQNGATIEGNGSGAGAVITGGSSGPGVQAYSNGTATAGRFEAQGTGYGVHAKADTTTPTRAALRIEPQDAAPSSPAMGDAYVNSADGKLRVYDGTTWQACW